MRAQRHNTPQRRLKLCLFAVLCCFADSTLALPGGAQVAQGIASLQQHGNTLTVTNSAGASINWQSFSIGANENVRFIQPSSSSAVLNRVVGSNPSSLLGLLQSNGRVWLINPAGILIGPGAHVNVAEFVASTLPVRDQDFLANRLRFQGGTGFGSVSNQGLISTPDGGHIYLIGSTVENSGTLQAPGGSIALAAGTSVSIGDSATPGVMVEVGAGSVSNVGRIAADSGQIGLVGAVVKNSGMIDASSAVRQGGRVFLLGDQVSLLDGARVNASGATGGGTVLVGGDAHGANPAVPNARTTNFDSGAVISADAVQRGDGGKVVLWSNDSTRAYGSISARGGAQGGNGGWIEVSGKRALDFHPQTIETRAPAGRTGTILLDPADVSISDNPSAAVTSGSSTDDNGAPNGATYHGGNTGANINWGDVDKLLASTDVYITTDGDGASNGGQIFILSSHSYNSANALNLFAHGDISATGVNVSNNGTGAINLTAGWNGSWAGQTGTSLPAVNLNDAGTGSIIIQNSTIKTAGDMNWSAADQIQVLGGNGDNLSSTVFAGGALTMTASGLTIQGGDGGNNNFAYVGSAGDQTLNLTNLTVSGGGSSGTYANNYAKLEMTGNGNTQTINIDDSGNIVISSGSGSGMTDYIDGAGKTVCTACTSNNYAAVISSGEQDISFNTFFSASTLELNGGGAGVGNHALLQAGNGQFVTGRPDISLTGGTGGSPEPFTDSSGQKVHLGNGAVIRNTSSDQPQTIEAASLTMDGGGDEQSTGGAFILSPTQVIDVSGSMSMYGGASTLTPGTPAVLGGHDLTLTVAGDLALIGDNSPVIVGNLSDGSAEISYGGNFYTDGNVQFAPNTDIFQDPTLQDASQQLDSTMDNSSDDSNLSDSWSADQGNGDMSVSFSTSDDSFTYSASADSTSAMPSTDTAGAPAAMLMQDTRPPTATVNLAALSAMLTQHHQQRTSLYQDALEQLRRNPAAADAPECKEGMAQDEVCIPSDTRAQVLLNEPTAVVPAIHKRLALLIGNDAYREKGIPPLNTPVADVRAVAQELSSKYHFDTRVLTNATKADIFRAMRQLADAVEPADSVFIMYAGHGYLMDDNNMGFWIPVDAQTSSVRNWVSNSDISRFLRAIPARQVMLVSDSCFSGSLTREQRIKDEKPQTRLDILRQRSVTALSSGGEEPVADAGAKAGHSVFAGHLLDSLADLKQDETGFELYQSLFRAITQELPQTPQYGGVLSAGHSGHSDYLLDISVVK